MRAAILCLVGLAFLGGEVARAQDIRWASSFDEALKEAKERGVLILCVFNMSDPPEPANEEMIRLFSSSKPLAKVCRDFVCIWANKDRHREVRQKVDGKMRSVCPLLGNAPCGAHQEVEKVVVRRYGDVLMSDLGDVKSPCQFLLDGDGKVVEVIAAGDRNTGFDVLAEGDIVMRLQAASRKNGPGLSTEDFHRLNKLVEEGNRLRAEGSYAAAAAKYGEVLKATTKRVGSVDAAEAGLKAIAEIGEKTIVEADALAEAENFAGAMELLEKVAKEFKGSDAETKAKERLRALSENPEVARLIQDAEARRQSDELLATGQAAEKRKLWKKALDAYKTCIERYPETAAGQAAKTRLAELEADPAIGAAIREALAAKDCKSWLNLARNFISNNLPDRARVYLRKVLDEYPGTSYAEQAQELLDGLK